MEIGSKEHKKFIKRILKGLNCARCGADLDKKHGDLTLCVDCIILYLDFKSAANLFLKNSL